jgi:demethylmenaquinone methyltransferase/2-methoxy-6-polyprenyl-1,4-benzoquinol methylase
MSDKKKNVKEIFDSIAFRYDLLNHLLSFGFDCRWRKKALKLSAVNSQSVLLDVACGTGDFAIDAFNMGVKQIVGGDFSYNMLKLFSKKNSWSNGHMVQIKAERIPLKLVHSPHAVAFG